MNWSKQISTTPHPARLDTRAEWGARPAHGGGRAHCSEMVLDSRAISVFSSWLLFDNLLISIFASANCDVVVVVVVMVVVVINSHCHRVTSRSGG